MCLCVHSDTLDFPLSSFRARRHSTRIARSTTPNGAPRTIRLGQTASVSIVTGVARNVLTVPSSAVTTVGTTSTVTLLQNGQQSVRPVEVGLVGDSSTEIKSGLQAGDVVVLATGTASSGFTFPGGGVPGGFGGLGG